VNNLYKKAANYISVVLLTVISFSCISTKPLFIEIPQTLLEGDKTEVQLEVYNNGVLIDQTKTNFLGPRSFN